MKILLDEHLPSGLADSFPDGWDIRSTQRMDWQGKENVELLQLAAERGFDALNEPKRGMEAGVHDGEVVPVLAAFLGSPSRRAKKRWLPPSGVESWKAPGMQLALASEFLRNLHWDGFKPDRHIRRMMGR